MCHASKWLALGAALVCAAGACTDPAGPSALTRTPGAARAQAGNGGAPTEATTDITLEGLCADFPVRLEWNGLTKTVLVGKGQGTTLVLSPGLKAQVTNVNTGRSVSLSITGAFHQFVSPEGNAVTVVTGRNLLYDPIAGLVVAEGVFRFAFDPAGNLVEPLNGTGRLIDLCALLGAAPPA